MQSLTRRLSASAAVAIGPRRLFATRSAASQSGSATGTGTKLREPARVRSDNAPLYEQMRRERRNTTERVAQEKGRADLRRRQIIEASAGADKDSDTGTSQDPTRRSLQLQEARAKPARLPPNCMAWRDYALFADAPRLRPLKSLDDAEDGGSFAGLLRRSAFVSLGSFENRIVCGRIFERFENSLYIDFGGKFHTVCPAPRVNNDQYVRGVQVMLRLLDPELTSRFLGSECHVTLGEADAVLLGLRPAESGDEARSADAEAEAAASQAGGIEADTVSPLRPSVLQPALLEEAEAEALADDDLAMTDHSGSRGQPPRIL